MRRALLPIAIALAAAPALALAQQGGMQGMGQPGMMMSDPSNPFGSAEMDMH